MLRGAIVSARSVKTDDVNGQEELKLISIEELATILAYPSVAALRKAISRNYLEITVFRIPHRRGLFTRKEYVNQYLETLGGK